MVYRILADAVVLVHAAFVAFVVLGGFLAWRWRWVVWLHVPCALWGVAIERSEEHTSELQSPCNLVCRLLLEKKKPNQTRPPPRRASYSPALPGPLSTSHERPPPILMRSRPPLRPTPARRSLRRPDAVHTPIP